MPYRYNRYLRPLFLVGDLLILNFAYWLSYYVLFNDPVGVYEQPYLTLVTFANLAWLFLALISQSYNFSRVSRLAKLLRGLAVYILLHLLLVSAFWVFQKAFFYSREFLIVTYFILVPLAFTFRTAGIYLLRIYRKKGFNRRNVIIFGFGEVAEELRKFFMLHPESGYRFIGYYSNRERGPRIQGGYRELKEYCSNNRIDEIYCCIPYVRYDQIQKLIDYGEENLIKIKLISDFRGFSFKGLELERYDNIPVLNVTSIPLDDMKNRIVKRSFDIVFSSIFIVFVMSWLYPLIALLIKIDSRGPVIFRQKRTGKENENFVCFKFRTMKVNDQEHKQATKDDDRITTIGKFLRKTSIDEFPQFFNVLRGDMSVVGPRPHMLHQTEEYSRKIEKFMARHFVKPGITGLAQAKGYRGETKELYKMKSRVKLDRFYVENWSLLFDLKIILLTAVSLYKERDKAF